MPQDQSPKGAVAHPSSLQEVRYSLKELMGKVETEREKSFMAKEIIDQAEIGRFFTKKKSPKKNAPRKKA